MILKSPQFSLGFSKHSASPMALAPQEITEISESISSITLQFEEATPRRFYQYSGQLGRSPMGNRFRSILRRMGLRNLPHVLLNLRKLDCTPCPSPPQDIAGNVAQGVVQYTFRLVLVLPSVSSVELGGQTGDVAFPQRS